MDIVLVGTVIILIGLDVHSRANGRAMSERASADQGDAYGVSGDRHHASHASSVSVQVTAHGVDSESGPNVYIRARS